MARFPEIALLYKQRLDAEAGSHPLLLPLAIFNAGSLHDRFGLRVLSKEAVLKNYTALWGNSRLVRRLVSQGLIGLALPPLPSYLKDEDSQLVLAKSLKQALTALAQPLFVRERVWSE